MTSANTATAVTSPSSDSSTSSSSSSNSSSAPASDSASMLVMPLESAEFVMQHAKSVKINSNGVEKLAHKIYASLKDKNCNYFNWKSAALNPKKMNEFAINWIFMIDTLNFSFWSDHELAQQLGVVDVEPLPDSFKMPPCEKYTVVYNHVPYSGYLGFCAAVNRALDEGFPITEPYYYAHISEQELRHIFRSDTSVQIPMFDARLKVLRETGKILLEEFQGTFLNCIRLANGSAKNLVKLIVDYFPAYRDETVFLDRKITFYKRAQILVADIWGCFEGQGYGFFADIDCITMFADYRVPQVLAFYNAIEYADDLKSFLKRNTLLTSGARYEVEIRAASIVACNLIAKQVRKIIEAEKPVVIGGVQVPKPIINDILVDFYLWNYRVDHAAEIDSNSLPFHKIRCIFY